MYDEKIIAEIKVSHRNVAHVFSFALKGSDKYEQEVPKALYGDRTGRDCTEIYSSCESVACGSAYQCRNHYSCLFINR